MVQTYINKITNGMNRRPPNNTVCDLNSVTFLCPSCVEEKGISSASKYWDGMCLIRQRSCWIEYVCLQQLFRTVGGRDDIKK